MGSVADVLRNHIVPRHESINSFSKWDGGIPTLGKRSLDVKEAHMGDYTVEGQRILTRAQGNEVSVYQIDGVIISQEELNSFHMLPLARIPDDGDTVTEMVTHSTQSHYSPDSGGYPVPGGYPAASGTYVAPGGSPDGDTETTTVTHITTHQ